MSAQVHITDEQTIFDLIKTAMGEHVRLTIPLGEITPSHRLSDIGVDSVSALEMAASVEEQLDVRLPDDQLARISSLEELVKLIQRTLHEQVRGGQ